MQTKLFRFRPANHHIEIDNWQKLHLQTHAIAWKNHGKDPVIRLLYTHTLANALIRRKCRAGKFKSFLGLGSFCLPGSSIIAAALTANAFFTIQSKTFHLIMNQLGKQLCSSTDLASTVHHIKSNLTNTYVCQNCVFLNIEKNCIYALCNKLIKLAWRIQ